MKPHFQQEIDTGLNESYARAKAKRTHPKDKDFRPSVARKSVSHRSTGKSQQRSSIIFDDESISRGFHQKKESFDQRGNKIYQSGILNDNKSKDGISQPNMRTSNYHFKKTETLNSGERDMKLSNLMEYNKLSKKIGQKQSMLFRNAEKLREDQRLHIDIFEDESELLPGSGFGSRNEPAPPVKLAEKFGVSSYQSHMTYSTVNHPNLNNFNSPGITNINNQIRQSFSNKTKVPLKQNLSYRTNNSKPGSRLEQLMGNYFTNPSQPKTNNTFSETKIDPFAYNLQNDMFANNLETPINKNNKQKINKRFSRMSSILNDSMTPQKMREQDIISRQIKKLDIKDIEKETQNLLNSGASEEQIINEILIQNKELTRLRKELFKMENHPDNVYVKETKLDKLKAKNTDLGSKLEGLKAQVMTERKENREVAEKYHRIKRRLEKLDQIETEERQKQINRLKKLDRRCAQLTDDLENADQQMANRRERFRLDKEKIVERETRQLKEILDDDDGSYLKDQMKRMIQNLERKIN